ncbi:hypoxanthine phosphoribosyltransferase [Ferrimonas sediminicola]|uniref:Hypoxanthine phosphoribosyltransferase n=1 Tax=Ferrimonas sediminicola TaxID=2569538 RepID=A0A4U1BMY2_9GAMM|nr:hypoxanthine phosphoribosyltransferase [Ferrimonas sediminicola]TKB51478.1 hypoxanthine phosphoribosyltransferase [Ferrimonas sediminicola]
MKHTLEVMISEAEINQALDKMAEQINRDYAGVDSLLVVGLLKGSVIVMSDLVRRLDGNVHLDFMTASSYGESTESSGDVKIVMDLARSIKNRHVLVVEDIIDTGRTLSKVLALLKSREPASLAIASFLDKPSRRLVDVEVKYVGVAIPDEFVVGYGLDYAEAYRQLPYIAKVIPAEE